MTAEYHARLDAERKARVSPPDTLHRVLPPEGAKCVECVMGMSIYIPCGKSAEFMIENRGEVNPMCWMCADHNVRNRGASYQRKVRP